MMLMINILVLLDTDKGILHIIDNGNGFDEDSFYLLPHLELVRKKIYLILK